jgi:hypothetical protein
LAPRRMPILLPLNGSLPEAAVRLIQRAAIHWFCLDGRFGDCCGLLPAVLRIRGLRLRSQARARSSATTSSASGRVHRGEGRP